MVSGYSTEAFEHPENPGISGVADTSELQRGRGKKRERTESTSEDIHTSSHNTKFIITDETRKYYRRFKCVGREMTLKIVTPPETVDPIAWLEKAIGDIYDYCTRDVSDTSEYIGFKFDAPSFAHGPPGLSFRPIRDCHEEDIWSLLFGVTQSATDFAIDDAFRVSVTRVSNIVGAGRKSKPLTNEEVQKRSLLEIPRDNLCLPRALIAGRAYIRKDEASSDAAELCWSVVRRAGSTLQRQAAQALCKKVGIEVRGEGCGMREIAIFQDHFAKEGLAILVYDFNTFGRGGDLIYNGERVVTERGRCVDGRLHILYYPRGGHYKPILNLTAAAANRRFCAPCNVAYRHAGDHKCTHGCSSCVGVPRCDPAADRLLCVNCGRWFFGGKCLQRHRLAKSFNARKSVCGGYNRLVDRTKRVHSCGKSYCRTCGSIQPVNHECYMRRVERDSENAKYVFVFYDFETQQCDSLGGNGDANLHVPSLCVAHQTCSACIQEPDIRTPCPSCGLVREFIFRENPVKQLVEFVTRDVKEFKKIICIAHNARGFDSQFILRYLVEQNRDPPRIILNGSKIVLMDSGHTRFLDSLAYMPMALAALPKAFGLPVDLRKGYFPHLFNTPENQNYTGPLPPARFYSPDSMTTAGRTAFYDWYEEAVSKGHAFDFRTEIVDYCRSDVDILRRACVAFRNIFLDYGDVCPFTRSTTIALACTTVLQQNF